MENQSWMIYGANGYTGELIAKEAKRRGLKPILAGRSAQRVTALAEQLGFESRIFDLDQPDTVVRNLTGVKAVLHCAGPFSSTHKPIFDACLKTKTHYLDITGEIRVFERVHYKRNEILKAGIVAMPGVGFDIVPSDCLAAMLKRALPDATHLTLAFKMKGGPSPGTSKTLIEGLPAGGVVRKDGKLTLVKSAYGVRKIKFFDSEDLAVTIPWGDVSTAFYSTGIPNIEVYIGASKGLIYGFKLLRPFRLLTALGPVQSMLKYFVGKTVTGDSETQRAFNKIWLWGEATNSQGKRVEKRLQTPDGYELTVDSSLRIVERILKGDVKPGPVTPSQAFGPDFVLSLKGVTSSP